MTASYFLDTDNPRNPLYLFDLLIGILNSSQSPNHENDESNIQSSRILLLSVKMTSADLHVGYLHKNKKPSSSILLVVKMTSVDY